MPHETISGLMTIEQTAQELGTTKLAVKRLIARGRIPATRLGESGSLRIRGEDVSSYVAAGARDFDHPEWADNWFVPLRPDHQAFWAAMSEAAEEQFPKRLPQNGRPPNRSELRVTGAIRELVEGPVPRSAFCHCPNSTMHAEMAGWRPGQPSTMPFRRRSGRGRTANTPRVASIMTVCFMIYPPAK